MAVVRDRALGFAVAEGLPGSLLGGVLGAVDGLQFGRGRVVGEPVEHAAGPIEGSCLPSPTAISFAPVALHQLA